MNADTNTHMEVRAISPEEFTAFTKNKDVNPLHSIGYYNRLIERKEDGRLYGGFENGQLVIAVACRMIRAWKVFHWLYAPLGIITEPYNDFSRIAAFMEGLKELVKKENVLYFRMESDIELQERNSKGEIVENGYNNKAYREGLEKIGFTASELKVGYDNTRQTRWASVLDLVDYKTPRTGTPATEEMLAHFEDNFSMLTPEILLKNMELKTRQSLKLAGRPYIKVRTLGYDELDKLSSLEASAADHHGFQSNSPQMNQAMVRAYGEDCEVLYAWLDVQEYVRFMTGQYEEAQAHLKDREQKYEESPGRRNKKALNTARQDQETAQRKYQEALQLEKEYPEEIPLSAALFLKTPTETIYLSSGSNREFMRFAGAFAIQWQAIQESLARRALRYNFWGISGIFDPEDPSYGVFAFKKGFNARVAEYAGEFTYVFNPVMTRLYFTWLDSRKS